MNPIFPELLAKSSMSATSPPPAATRIDAKAWIVSLPPEILIEIFRPLETIREVENLSLTCRYFRSVWENHAKQFLLPLARKEVAAFDDALLAVGLSSYHYQAPVSLIGHLTMINFTTPGTGYQYLKEISPIASSSRLRRFPAYLSIITSLISPCFSFRYVSSPRR